MRRVVIGEDQCATYPRWSLTNMEWQGYVMAVRVRWPDDEEAWHEVDGFHRDLGGFYDHGGRIPDEFLADPENYRDPRTWCSHRPEGAM